MRVDIDNLDDSYGFWKALIKGESIWYDDICMGMRYALWGDFVYIVASDCLLGEVYFLKFPFEKLGINDIDELERYFEVFHRRMKEIFDKATDIILEFDPENPDNTLDKALLMAVEEYGAGRD